MNESEWRARFSYNLTTMLELRNMTQKELAVRSGVSEGTISKYVWGIQMPTVKAVVNMAYALNCDYDELIDFGGRID